MMGLSKSEQQQFLAELVGTPLLKPREIVVNDNDGVQKTFLISKFDAVVGREIIAQYPLAMLPKVGEYRLSESLMFLLMAYVAVQQEGAAPMRLTNRALVNNHVTDAVQLLQIEWAMMENNFGFFIGGRTLSLLEAVGQKYLRKIIEMLTGSSATSQEINSPVSTNSAPSTP